MEFSSNHFLLLGFFIGFFIVVSLGSDGQWESGDIIDGEFDFLVKNDSDGKAIYYIETKGNPHLYSAANLRAMIEKASGKKVVSTMGKTHVHLFGRISREDDLAKLDVVRHDFSFCNLHFIDLNNFLGALNHGGIHLEEFFAVMSPCVHLLLNGQLAKAKHFFYSDYVLQTPQMVITNLGAMEMNEGNLDAKWLVDWLLFRIDANLGLGMTKKLEIKGGEMKIATNLVEMLIARYYRGELERLNFVLKLNGFELDAKEFAELINGNAFSLIEITKSIWEMRCGNELDEKEGNENEEEKVEAIFEIGKFTY